MNIQGHNQKLTAGNLSTMEINLLNKTVEWIKRERPNSILGCDYEIYSDIDVDTKHKYTHCQFVGVFFDVDNIPRKVQLMWNKVYDYIPFDKWIDSYIYKTVYFDKIKKLKYLNYHTDNYIIITKIDTKSLFKVMFFGDYTVDIKKEIKLHKGRLVNISGSPCVVFLRLEDAYNYTQRNCKKV